ncbi:MAG: bifunctional metallophosphatase/5'-nucleotidase, partial [Bacillaceae bacterium]
MSLLKNVFRIMLVACLALTGMVTYVQPTFAEESNEKVINEKVINIIHTNDTHGRIKEDSKVIGIDTVSQVKKSMKNAILVDAGDTLHGLPFVTMNKGADVVALMNLAGYDYLTVGNHDFNYGQDRLLELKGMANFPVFGANVKKGNSTVLDSNDIKTIDGVKVGFFGLASPETAYKTNPNNVTGITFENPIDSAKEQVKALQQKGADVIIALAHIGLDGSTEITSDDIAAAVPGIDVIIDGHSHTTLPEGLKVDGVDGNDTLIASTGEYLGNIGHVTLTVDANTNKLVKKEASLISKADSAAYGKDEKVTNKIKEIDDAQKPILSAKVGETSVKLEGAREFVRTQETNLGNLLTDAMIDETGADIAITNGGGIRASIEAGTITKGNVIDVLPFGNYVVTKKLTGEQIKAVLEHGV